MTTRNARLTAIRSLFRYAALRHPQHARLIQRLLATPSKRHEQITVCFLTLQELTRCPPHPTAPAGTGDETTR